MSSIAMAADSTQADYLHRQSLARRKKATTKPKQSSSKKHQAETNKVRRKPQQKSQQKSRHKSSSRRRHDTESDEDDDGEDESSDNESDLDLSKELLPISSYVRHRDEMVEHMFRSISIKKLKAMLPPIMKTTSLTELKSLCIQQLEGMSKKRICKLLDGVDAAAISSSGTEDSSAHSSDAEDGDHIMEPVDSTSVAVAEVSNDYIADEEDENSRASVAAGGEPALQIPTTASTVSNSVAENFKPAGKVAMSNAPGKTQRVVSIMNEKMTSAEFYQTDSTVCEKTTVKDSLSGAEIDIGSERSTRHVKELNAEKQREEYLDELIAMREGVASTDEEEEESDAESIPSSLPSLVSEPDLASVMSMFSTNQGRGIEEEEELLSVENDANIESAPHVNLDTSDEKSDVDKQKTDYSNIRISVDVSADTSCSIINDQDINVVMQTEINESDNKTENAEDSDKSVDNKQMNLVSSPATIYSQEISQIVEDSRDAIVRSEQLTRVSEKVISEHAEQMESSLLEESQIYVVEFGEECNSKLEELQIEQVGDSQDKTISSVEGTSSKDLSRSESADDLNKPIRDTEIQDASVDVNQKPDEVLLESLVKQHLIGEQEMTKSVCDDSEVDDKAANKMADIPRSPSPVKEEENTMSSCDSFVPTEQGDVNHVEMIIEAEEHEFSDEDAGVAEFGRGQSVSQKQAKSAETRSIDRDSEKLNNANRDLEKNLDEKRDISKQIISKRDLKEKDVKNTDSVGVAKRDKEMRKRKSAEADPLRSMVKKEKKETAELVRETSFGSSTPIGKNTKKSATESSSLPHEDIVAGKHKKKIMLQKSPKKLATSQTPVGGESNQEVLAPRKNDSPVKRSSALSSGALLPVGEEVKQEVSMPSKNDSSPIKKSSASSSGVEKQMSRAGSAEQGEVTVKRSSASSSRTQEQLKPSADTDSGDGESDPGHSRPSSPALSKTQLEILELEMRARAIKAMLKAQEDLEKLEQRKKGVRVADPGSSSLTGAGSRTKTIKTTPSSSTESSKVKIIKTTPSSTVESSMVKMIPKTMRTLSDEKFTMKSMKSLPSSAAESSGIKLKALVLSPVDDSSRRKAIVPRRSLPVQKSIIRDNRPVEERTKISTPVEGQEMRRVVRNIEIEGPSARRDESGHRGDSSFMKRSMGEGRGSREIGGRGRDTGTRSAGQGTRNISTGKERRDFGEEGGGKDIVELGDGRAFGEVMGGGRESGARSAGQGTRDISTGRGRRDFGEEGGRDISTGGERRDRQVIVSNHSMSVRATSDSSRPSLRVVKSEKMSSRVVQISPLQSSHRVVTSSSTKVAIKSRIGAVKHCTVKPSLDRSYKQYPPEQLVVRRGERGGDSDDEARMHGSSGRLNVTRTDKGERQIRY